ncbi:dihydrolipoyl dehydrogenase [Bradyrhizobium sp. GCM10027634]|uniref:dihydrolipoyl dehydrogenase n=1 Tax=unclassified Bradyrhizobium TaxID=2631580 RepID=UPI00188B902E|nr:MULTISPECIES: dihydrolipoyl dehydrogenase [unclassified Bradyrhizobium]MDN4999865.1 dihydrolipoyl dehydrogenase [Bradyrhizobium sp. WYCCWR 12677]QOZ43241.1 dihydrolipoyl dehydrogenase [Bradyrhizobium sp. CCBAU 53340]
MQEHVAEVVIIGGGPGGYVAAIRAGQLGLRTVLIERAALGGTCLNVGCIPSKALIHAADAFHAATRQRESSPFGLRVKDVELDFARTIAWKDSIVTRLAGGVAGLLKKSGVSVISGQAEILDGKTVRIETADATARVRARHLVLATGSSPQAVTTLPFGGNVISSTEALSLRERPKRLVVVGGGYIGLELGIAFAKLGSEVTVVESDERILPRWDAALTRPVARRLEDLNVSVITSAHARGLTRGGECLLVQQRGHGSRELAADKFLVAVGREPCTKGFGLERLDLAMEGKFVKINARCETSMSNVWAIGDLTGEPMLAHRAMAQGVMVAEIIAGHRRSFDALAIPSVCFTDPELVCVGYSPEQAKAEGLDIKVATFPFAANGRALTQMDDEGFVRIVARSDDHLVIGGQAVGAGVSELTSSLALAIEMGAVLEDLARTIGAHPTRSEAIHEAAFGALGQGLHI